MNVGSLVYATDQGLGILARSFFKHGVVSNALVVKHPAHPNHYDWYPTAPTTPIKPFDTQLAHSFCKKFDAMLFFETPFDWSLIDWCREHGVRTFLMTMYECTPRHLPATPDVFLCPSKLDLEHFPSGKLAPVPVEVAWKQRTRAEVFVHNAGHGGLKGRNGTEELLEAMRFVKSPIKLIVRSQKPLSLPFKDARIDLRVGTVHHEYLWDEGDVFVFPEKFNGLSLPLQEARAAGMLVMCGDRFPMNDWLPAEPLIKVKSYRPNQVGGAYREFKEAMIDPKDIAKAIDRVYGSDVTDYSLAGREWAKTMSWDVLGPFYRSLLTGRGEAS